MTALAPAKCPGSETLAFAYLQALHGNKTLERLLWGEDLPMPKAAGCLLYGSLYVGDLLLPPGHQVLSLILVLPCVAPGHRVLRLGKQGFGVRSSFDRWQDGFFDPSCHRCLEKYTGTQESKFIIAKNRLPVVF